MVWQVHAPASVCEKIRHERKLGSMEPNVKIESFCKRCNKKDEQHVGLEEAGTILEKRKNRDVAREELELALTAELLNDATPDIVVAVRSTKTGQYQLKMLDRAELCHSPDAKRQKGCLPAVENLLESLYLEPRKGRRVVKDDTETEE